MLVELKTPPCQEGLLEARVADLLQAYDGPCAVLSFNAEALGWMARRHPQIPRGLNLSAAPRAADLDLASPAFLSIHQSLATLRDVQSTRAGGRPVIAWTVHSADEQARLASLVDNVMFEGFSP